MATVQHYLNYSDANVVNMAPQFNSNNTVQTPEKISDTWDYFNHARLSWTFNRMGFSDSDAFTKLMKKQNAEQSEPNKKWSDDEKILIGVGLLALYFYALKF